MAINLVVNGITYSYPQTGDNNWGDQANLWASAVTSGMLSKAGGAFALTGAVAFGSSFGLSALYWASNTANPSATGVVRLANADGIGFRNSGNTADFLLKPDADGFLQYNNIDLLNLSGAQTLTNKTISGASNTITNLALSSFALTSAQIIVGNVSNLAAAVAMSGDIAITNAGVTTIQAGAVTLAKMANLAANSLIANNTGSPAVPTVLSLVSTASVSSAMLRDLNANTQVNSLAQGFTSTPSAAGTTTLTVTSTYTQQFTGVTTQTVVLPAANTLVLGQQFSVLNRSTGVVTVNANGGGLIQAMAANTIATFTVTNIATGPGTWDSAYALPAGTGTVSSVTFTGDGTFLSSTPSTAVTTTGTLTAALKTQTKNTFLAGPTTGGVANPTFRALNIADFVPPTFQKFLQTIYYTFTVTSANATLGATYTNNAQTFTVVYTIAAGTTLVCSATGAPTGSGTLTKSGGTGDATIAFSVAVANGTYTTPSSPAPLYIRVIAVGGGGGGGGSNSSGSVGGTGANTTFGSSLITSGGGIGGNGGNTNGNGGLGGTATIAGPAVTVKAITGGGGGTGLNSASYTSGYAVYLLGGLGGSSAFGGAGASTSTAGGNNAVANSGSGGAGGGLATPGVCAGGGGGSSAFCEAIIVSPSATYTYVIGAGGIAGSGAGGNLGGIGGSGQIIVEEYYQ